MALGVLSAEEKFTLRISESSASSISASVSSGLRQLAQPFKLRLRKAASRRGSEILRDYSHHVVLIEPLATMASVQDFLWPTFRESDRGGVTGLKINARRRLGQTTHTGHTSSAPGQDDQRRTTGSGEGNGDQVADEIDEDRYADEAIFGMEGDNNEEEMVDEDDHNSDPSDVEASSGEKDFIEQDVGEGSDQDPDGADSLDVEISVLHCLRSSWIMTRLGKLRHGLRASQMGQPGMRRGGPVLLLAKQTTQPQRLGRMLLLWLRTCPAHSIAYPSQAGERVDVDSGMVQKMPTERLEPEFRQLQSSPLS